MLYAGPTRCGIVPIRPPLATAHDVVGLGAAGDTVFEMPEICEIDLTAFGSASDYQKRAIAAEAIDGLQTGFVYARHDLSDDLIDTAYGLLQTFFDLPQESKDTAQAVGSNGQAGYTPRMVETAVSSTVADWKEMLNWGTRLPAIHPLRQRYPSRYGDPTLPDDLVPGIAETVFELHRHLEALQRSFLRVVAIGIGCHENYFDIMTKNGATLSRAIYYPPMGDAPELDGQQPVWAAEHGDINVVTALPRATGRGLQILVNEDWVDAVPPLGSAILNTGMMLEHITNGVVPTGIHRVVADSAQSGGRLSVVQFMHPTPTTILSPVASCISPDNPQRFSDISADDQLNQVLYDINLSDR